MDWFVWKDKEQVGPFSEEAIHAMAERGDIQPSTLLWHADLPKWTVAAQVPGIGVTASPSFPPPPVPKLFGAAAPARAVPAQSVPAYSGAAQSIPSSVGPGYDGSMVHTVVRDVARPWARFWARSVDMLVSAGLLGVMLGIVAPSLFEPGSSIASGSGSVIFALITLPLAMVVDAGVYALFGNTLGKLIAGVKVLTTDGQKLTFAAYLHRNLGLYVQGYGLGIPLVNFGLMIYCWRKAAGGGTLGWDVATNSRCFSAGNNLFRNFVTAFIWIVIIVFISASRGAAGV